MGLDVKICGLSDRAGLAAAVAGGADLVGFNFYPPSPRSLRPAAAKALAESVPHGITRVGLFVDPDDRTLADTLALVPLEMLQLHGNESPARLGEIKAATGKAVMKVIKLRGPEDLAAAEGFYEVADRLLFDAKAPADLANALPGGNALVFDWRILAGRRFALPWMLAGGLTPDTIAQAVETTGARGLDVSSGVERKPGDKDPALIRRFLEAARSVERSLEAG